MTGAGAGHERLKCVVVRGRLPQNNKLMITDTCADSADCPPPRLGLGGPEVLEGMEGPRWPGLGGLGGNEGPGAGRGRRRLRPPGPLARRLLGGRGRHRDWSLRR
eukprot:7959418-Alexandrium_andersonii.AAC.1